MQFRREREAREPGESRQSAERWLGAGKKLERGIVIWTLTANVIAAEWLAGEPEIMDNAVGACVDRARTTNVRRAS